MGAAWRQDTLPHAICWLGWCTGLQRAGAHAPPCAQVSVSVPVPAGTKAKQLEVVISKTKLKVALKGSGTAIVQVGGLTGIGAAVRGSGEAACCCGGWL